MEIAGVAGGPVVPATGGPALALAIRDWAFVEAGANLMLVAERENFATGYIGSRFTWAPNQGERTRFAADVELGFGMGVGGALCGNTSSSGNSTDHCTKRDSRSWRDRMVIGGYNGLGIGGIFGAFSLYLRTRVEVTHATNIPVTVWPSVFLGLGVNARDHVSFDLGGGFLGYYNEADTQQGWFYHLSVTVMFDVSARARERR